MEMRRCILFAGYNSAENIDEVDLYHIEKLVEIGDVFCCYDNADMPDSQIQKLKQLGVKKAFATRHGEYDFGSWKRLFRAVGWDEISKYDEIIIVNNSIILIGDLFDFIEDFERSDAEFFASCLLNEHYPGPTVSVSDYLERQNPFYDNSMFPSVFWAMKASLVAQPFVRNFFENIRTETNRLDVCYKYEREFSRKILRRKIKTALCVDIVYPHSFLYTEVAFSLVRHGFPYLKRKTLLAEFYSLRVLDARVEGVCLNIPKRPADILRTAYDLAKYPDRVFNPEWYLQAYPDVATAKLNPEDHYTHYGKAEGRMPNPNESAFRARQKALEEASQANIFEVDEDWYAVVYSDVEKSGMDAAEHFAQWGAGEGRDPNSKFSSVRHLRSHPELEAKGVPAFEHFVANRDRKYEAKQQGIASEYADSNKLLIFFNVAMDYIGGGMLSIDRFAANAKSMSRETGYDVAVSGVPLGGRAVQFTKFKPSIDQVEFRILAEMTSPDEVVIFLPEVFAVQFANDLTAFELSWLLQRKSLKIVIMNQNNELMPPPQELQACFFPITLDVTISTAHLRYCTQRQASRYMMPVKQLTPFLPAIKMSKLSAKEKIILLSPDPIMTDPRGLSRDYVVRMLETRLPDFEFITIQNMALEDYLDLASRAMFSITFGEGMDGYYIEPVLAGAISFAVYNSTFFPEEFRDVMGVFPDWTSVITQVPEFVNSLTNTSEYESIGKDIRTALEVNYSTQISQTEFRLLIAGEADYWPEPQSHCPENFATVKNELLSLDFKFFEFGEHHVSSLPDGTTVRYLGGDFYDVIYKVFAQRDYDLQLDPDQQYILIDIGANIGLASIYILNKYPNVLNAYAFEPVELTARIAQENIAGNGLSDRMELYQIGLSASFAQKRLQFLSERSTTFSTGNEMLAEASETSGELDSLPELVDIEVASASGELAHIFRRHPGKRFILKCDTEGSEFSIIASLDSADMLKNFEALIIETHFRSPNLLIDSLRRNGFSVETRCNSEVNITHTIWASRGEGRFLPRTSTSV